MHTLLIARLTRYTSFVALLGLGGLMYGCGSSDSGTPPNANPTGYYSQGSLSVSDGTITDNNALQAMVYNDRIIMMSAANNLLYDGTITSINQSSFSATFTIYDNGQNLVTASATGTITQGSSVTGTLSGTGLGNGTFSLTYALGNNNPAAIARIERFPLQDWEGINGSLFQRYYKVDSAGLLLADDTTGLGDFRNCNMGGTFIPISGVNVYTINVTVTGCQNTAINGTNYSGLAASRSEVNTDDRFILAVSNSTYSMYGEFQ
jgi:hypothetical protein